MEISFNLATPKFLSEIKISHILLLSAMLRLFVVSFPTDGMIFDETHYVPAVQAILDGIHANPEHPPLTKLIVAASVTVFGNFWFAWRMPMILSSLFSTYLVYLISKEFFDEKIALLAASFVIFDMVWFIHGNIFMLEPPAITFGLLFILMYLRKRYAWAGASIGLAGLANEKALFFVFGAVFYALFDHGIKPIQRETLKKVGVFILVTSLVGVGGLWAFDTIIPPSKATSVTVNVQATIIQDEAGIPLRTETATSTKTSQVYLNGPVEHVIWMWEYFSSINSNLETSEVNFRPPWNWVTPFTFRNKNGSTSLGVGIFNSATYLTSTVSVGDKQNIVINYRPQTPIFIWYMTIPIAALAVYKRKEREAKFIFSWILGTYVPWIVSDLWKQNMTFNHYFLPTIPIVVIGIPWFWQSTVPKYWKQITALHLLLTILFFFWYFPVGIRRTF